MNVGIDAVDVDRFVAVVNRTPGVLDRLFTPAERDRAVRSGRGQLSVLAEWFAAKEAVMKTLGAGFDRLSAREIEVGTPGRGEIVVTLSGRALERAVALGASPQPRIMVTVAQAGGTAMATAWLEGPSSDRALTES